jgi:hypothetical protein
MAQTEKTDRSDSSKLAHKQNLDSASWEILSKGLIESIIQAVTFFIKNIHAQDDWAYLTFRILIPYSFYEQTDCIASACYPPSV